MLYSERINYIMREKNKLKQWEEI